MEDLKALKQEAFDRKIEVLELSIKTRLLEIENLKENLKRTRAKEEVRNIKEEILIYEGYLESTKIELERLKKMNPDQYIEECVERDVEGYTRQVEHLTDFLENGVPDMHYATHDVRSEIMDMIDAGEIKAPKAYKRQDRFIEELMQTPEYQAKIQEEAKKRHEAMREQDKGYLEADKKYLSIIGSDSEEYLKSLIKRDKDDSAHYKELICGLDITKIFELPKSRWGEFSFEDRDVLEVVAQIPQEEYLESVRPQLIDAVENVLSEYNHDNRALLAKMAASGIGSAVAPIAAFAASPIIAMVGSSGSDMAAGAAFVGMVATWVAGGIGSYKLAKLSGKIADKQMHLRYEDYIRKEVERVLTDAGYMQKENIESAAQPGQN